MNITVIGTGYVGLVGAAVLSKWGNKVVGVDVDQAKLQRIQNGDMPIFEPGLPELVKAGLKNGTLRFTHFLHDGIKDADVVFICVGTPQGSAGDADLSAVLQVAKEIGKSLDHYAVIVTKSTVPVGTNLRVKEILKNTVKKNIEFDVVSNPEFLAQGSSVHDMENPARTVLGSDSTKALDIVASIFSHLKAEIVRGNFADAEMIKYVANCALATRVSFADSMAHVCEAVDADIEVVMRAVGLDPRIGPLFLKAGIGWGGSCFPKDVQALAYLAKQRSVELPQIQGTISTNERVHKRFVYKIKLHFEDNLEGKVFAALGVAFKAGTDDTRESPAIKVIEKLRGKGAKIRVYDPEAMENAKKVLGNTSIEYFNDPYVAALRADALLILTDWSEFKKLDLVRVKALLKQPVIFDGRNALNMNAVQDAGFVYYAMGRPTNGQTMIREKDRSYSAMFENGKNKVEK